MNLVGTFGLAILLSAACASAQQGVGAPILVDAGATRLSDERPDARLDQRPLAQEDKSLRTGRELKQGEAVVAILPPPPQQEDSSSPRVRARALLEEDRARVKREAAILEAE